MSRIRNIHGGGSRTNKNGLRFKQQTCLEIAMLEFQGYSIDGIDVKFNGNIVAQILSKRNLYRYFLEPRGINYSDIISKQLIQDEAILVFNSNIIYIIEKKFQSSSGSVDEKLQTCNGGNSPHC